MLLLLVLAIDSKIFFASFSLPLLMSHLGDSGMNLEDVYTIQYNTIANTPVVDNSNQVMENALCFGIRMINSQTSWY